MCSKQTPFTLTLRLWDIYILEGERVLTAMAYTILKLHKSKVTPDPMVVVAPCWATLVLLTWKALLATYSMLGALCWLQKAQFWGGNEMPQGLTCCAQYTETTPEILPATSSCVLCRTSCF